MQLFLAFLVALSVTAALIPPLARWAPSLGLTDRPGPRKLHAVAVPRVGGVAMAIGILIPLLTSVRLVPQVSGLLAGLVVLLVFGVWDDRTDLNYRVKFLGQCLAALAVMLIGDLRIDSLTILSRESLPAPISAVVTLAFLVGVTNAVNLSDGLDGLAGGMVLLCLSAVALLAASGGASYVTMIALIEAGAILGFLRFNTHPARVFMGDAGSQILGFTLGVLSICATQSETSVLSASLPLLLLGMPILDTAVVMLRRIRAGLSPFSADRMHLHHRLLRLGFPHRGAVVIIYLAQGALVLGAYFLRFESDLLIVVTYVCFGSVLIGTIAMAERRGWRWSGSPAAPILRHYVMQVATRRIATAAALATMYVALMVYAAGVAATSVPAHGDLFILCCAMLVVLLLASLARNRATFAWVDRPSAYLLATVLIYLDQTSPMRPGLLVNFLWALLATAAIAAALRFAVSTERRFELTSLDMLVVFIATVLPNLPGQFELPANLTTGIVKAVVLLYVVEMLLSADAAARFARASPIVVLAAVVARGALAYAA
jgi:UDP-GlcNAc:undecaprenyl-phosphate GlcNAc-1-phosphate transferase